MSKKNYARVFIFLFLVIIIFILNKNVLNISKDYKLKESELPSKYNLNDITGIKLIQDSQGYSDLCVSYSLARVLESNIAKMYNKKVIYNPVHFSYGLDYLSDFYTVNEGSDFYNMLVYLTSGYGPVLKSATSELTNAKAISDSEKNKLSFTEEQILNKDNVDYQVDSTFAIRGKKYNSSEEYRNAIKTSIMNYGAVMFHGCKPSNNKYKNKNAIYCNKEESLTHAMIIIGWDDNYSKNNFKSGYRPQNDGAFLVQNSYNISGDSSMLYYYSYDSYFFDINNTASTYLDNGLKVWGVKSMSNKKYDKSYLPEDIGLVWYESSKESYLPMTTASDSIAYSSAKSSTNVEILKKISFYAVEDGTYEVYVNQKNGTIPNVSALDKYKKIASGKIDGEGLYSIHFDQKIQLYGTKFSIMIRFNKSNILAKTNSKPTSKYYLSNNQWVNKDRSFIMIYTDLEDQINATSLTINTKSITLKPGEKYQLKANITPSNATNQNVQWTSSNENIVSVDSNGLVTAKGIGKTFINANITGIGAKSGESCAITVEDDIKVAKITLNKSSLNLEKGQSTQLIATISPTNATNKTLTWKSSNTKVATVDSNGKIKAIDSGTATIKVSTNDGSSVSSTCKVTVKPSEIKINSIKLSNDKLELNIGEVTTLIATISPTNATNKTLTWKSSNTKVATVDSNGKIKAIDSGTATIKVSTNDGTSIYKEATIIVKKLNDESSETLSNNTNIKNILVNDIKVSSRNGNIFSYTVQNNINNLKINIILEDSKSTLVDLENEFYKDISSIDNIVIKVKSESGIIEKYYLEFIKEDNKPYLKELYIDKHNIQFNKYELEYEIEVDYNIDSINIKAVPENENIIISIDGNNNLKIGENIIKITLKHSNQVTTEYKIIVNKNEKTFTNVAYLSTLDIMGYIIDFDKNVNNYDIIFNNEESLSIIAIPEDKNAFIEIIGNQNLKVGSKVEIKVKLDSKENSYFINLINKKINIKNIITIGTLSIVIVGVLASFIYTSVKRKSN